MTKRKEPPFFLDRGTTAGTLEQFDNIDDARKACDRARDCGCTRARVLDAKGRWCHGYRMA